MATLSGTVKDAFGAYTSRKVRAYRQSDGSFTGTTVASDPVTGAFTIDAADTSPHYVVALGEIVPANSTKLLLHMDGANNSIAFTDVKGHSMTRIGTPIISTAQSVFGGASAYFDGDGDRLSTPASADYAFGDGDFTAEMRLYVTKSSGPSYFIGSTYQSGNFYMYHDGSGTIYFQCDYGSITGAASLNTWHHIAVCRKAGTTRLFINGASVGSPIAVDNSVYTNTSIFIGGADIAVTGVTTAWLGGYIDEVRVRKGYAMYEKAFTPAVSAFADTDETPPIATKAMIYDNIIPI